MNKLLIIKMKDVKLAQACPRQLFTTQLMNPKIFVEHKDCFGLFSYYKHFV
jgi:hypothetical protein